VESDVKTVEAIAKRVRDSIVTIRFQGRGGSDQGLGTGFVIAAEGLIATNYHVIGEARPVSVELSDGSRHDVTEIHASDRAADLAIVRIAKQGLSPLALGAPEKLLDGEEVEPELFGEGVDLGVGRPVEADPGKAIRLLVEALPLHLQRAHSWEGSCRRRWKRTAAQAHRHEI
jgi:S1-C subfamily serine protease